MQYLKALVLLLFLVIISCKHEIKVACVGDSITEGYGLAYQSKSAFPVVLDSILGINYSVLNCGRSATTMQKDGSLPFWTCKEFSNVFVFNPEIIIIKLGTNDTKPQNWNAIKFEHDYQSMIDTFRTITTKPEIYLCLPAPVFKTHWGINDSLVVHGVIPIIHKLAKTNNLKVIDLYSPLKNEAVNFFDSIHPNEKADNIIAHIIAKELNK
jgi:acyl-CoA thioesterase I